MTATIYIDPEPYALFWELTRQADTEVGGFGYITEREIDGYLYPVVDTIFLIDQEVTGSKIDFDDDQLAAAIERAVQDDRLEDLRFCIHSHCNHKVFWSATDDELIENIGQTGAPYLFSVVVNKARDTLGRLDIYKHNVPGIATIEQECQVEQTPIDGVESTAEALLKTHCKPPARPSYNKAWTKAAPMTQEIYFYGTLDEHMEAGESKAEARKRLQEEIPELDIDGSDNLWFDAAELDDLSTQAWESIPGVI
jgi:hypothetical protein